MNKYFQTLTLMASVLVLAGCSLSPQNIRTTGTQQAAKPNTSVWKSIDGGKNWEALSDKDKKINLASLDVISVATNPYDDKVAYVGTRGTGILKTEDGGDSWKYLNFQPEKIYGLGIDPVDARIIYASGVWQKRGKIYKSFDGGENWKEIYTAPSEGPIVIALLVDKKNSSNVFAATSDKQVIKTTDGGISWKNIFSSPAPVIKIAMDRGNSGLIYFLSQNNRVFRSKNGGQNFDDISKNFSKIADGNKGINVLRADPTNANWIYLAGSVGIIKSKDAGENWEEIGTLNDPQSFPVRALTVNPMNSGEIIYGASQATYHSVDGGKNWQTFQFNTSKAINLIEYSVADNNVLYLGLSK